jgi:thiamine biosynthesis lipoprotein
MRLNLGGIAKGWAARSGDGKPPCRGVENAIVNAGGNMKLNGNKNGKPWRIGIQDPRAPHGKYLGVLEITGDLAVATSGDYERFVERDGRALSSHHRSENRSAGESMPKRNDFSAHRGSIRRAIDGRIRACPEKGQQMLETNYPDCDALIIDAQGERHFTPHFKAHGGMVEIE